MTDTRDSFEKVAEEIRKEANFRLNMQGDTKHSRDMLSWADRLTALQAGAGDAQDAARYRWLRDHCNYGVMGSDNPPFSLNCDEPIAEWDAAIDREIGLDKQAIRAREPK